MATVLATSLSRNSVALSSRHSYFVTSSFYILSSPYTVIVFSVQFEEMGPQLPVAPEDFVSSAGFEPLPLLRSKASLI